MTEVANALVLDGLWPVALALLAVGVGWVGWMLRAEVGGDV